MAKLIDQGHSEYVIVLPDGAGEALLYAAAELARYLAKITGVILPVVGQSFSLGEKEICLGPVNRKDCPTTDGLIHDGFTLRTVGNRLFVTGGNDRGVVFGVYALLEEAFGCRFFSRKVEHVPARCCLDLPQIDLTRVSPFEYRCVFWYDMMDGDIAAKRGLNGEHNELQARHGNSIKYHYFVHSFVHYYVPLEKYGESHPEYYSMIDGKRKLEKMSTQLCLTNPEVLRLVIDQLREDIKAHPEATLFSLSQNDCYFPCQCPECARVDAEEGSYAGTPAALCECLRQCNRRGISECDH